MLASTRHGLSVAPAGHLRLRLRIAVRLALHGDDHALDGAAAEGVGRRVVIGGRAADVAAHRDHAFETEEPGVGLDLLGRHFLAVDEQLGRTKRTSVLAVPLDLEADAERVSSRWERICRGELLLL